MFKACCIGHLKSWVFLFMLYYQITVQHCLKHCLFFLLPQSTEWVGLFLLFGFLIPVVHQQATASCYTVLVLCSTSISRLDTVVW